MKLLKVKPSQVKVPELRVRAKFDQETLLQFQSSVREAGILAPVICCQTNEDLVLVDGEHRLVEAKTNQLPFIEVVVFEGDMVDVLTKNLFLDHMRGKTPVSDMVKVIGALYTDYGLDPDKIKEKTGLTRDYIEKLIKISQLDPLTFAVFEEGKIGMGMALELARLPYPIQREEVLAKISVIAEPKIQDFKEFVDATLREMELLKERPTKVATDPRPAAIYHCEGCKQEIEPRYLRPIMVCPECFGEVWRLAKAKAPLEEKKVEEGGIP